MFFFFFAFVEIVPIFFFKYYFLKFAEFGSILEVCGLGLLDSVFLSMSLIYIVFDFVVYT